MEDSAKFLNPWVLNFQKLGLELKCPLCLNLVNRPVLLPCNHFFCLSCIPGSTQCGADCPVCRSHFVNQDLRHLPFLENMAMIYKCLDATFSANFIQNSHSGTTDSGRVSFQSPGSVNAKFGENKRVVGTCLGDNLHTGRSMDTQARPEKIVKVENDSVAIDAKGVKFRSDVNNSSSSGCLVILDRETESAPDSPHSFGDARCSDNDSPHHCPEHSSQNSLVKRPSGENSSSRAGKIRNESSRFENDINFREVKREKQLNFGQGKLDASSADQIKAEVSYSGISMPNSGPELQQVSEPIEIHTPKSSEDLIIFTHATPLAERPPESCSGKSRSSSKRKKVTSEVWQYFDLSFRTQSNGSEERWGTCKVCRKSFQCTSRTHGTTQLKKHIGTCQTRLAQAQSLVAQFSGSVGSPTAQVPVHPMPSQEHTST